jgi:hypothetical protein
VASLFLLVDFGSTYTIENFDRNGWHIRLQSQSGEGSRAALYNKHNPWSLKPKSPNFYIDRNYILYGVGLLSEIEPQIALSIAKKYLVNYSSV